MPDNVRETFVKNLRLLMEAKGIKQADICRELGVSSATASDWCSGKKYPRADAIQKLADLLGVRFSVLTSENGLQEYEDQQLLESFHQDPELRLLFDHARKMPHEDVVLIAQFIERLKELRGDE